MGWLLFPKERSLLIFQRDRQPIEINSDIHSAQKLLVPNFLEIELSLTVDQVFGWLKLLQPSTSKTTNTAIADS